MNIVFLKEKKKKSKHGSGESQWPKKQEFSKNQPVDIHSRQTNYSRFPYHHPNHPTFHSLTSSALFSPCNDNVISSIENVC